MKETKNISTQSRYTLKIWRVQTLIWGAYVYQGGGGANIPGGSPSRGRDVMRKNVRKGGGQTKNLHHHQSYTLHAGPAERFLLESERG